MLISEFGQAAIRIFCQAACDECDRSADLIEIRK